MRNLKRALSLTLASVMLLGMMVMGSGAASYPDVSEEDNIEAIEVLQAVQVMRGDENGNFDPDRNVTRAEMAVVMALLLDLDYQYYEASCPFNDVPSWARPYVGACYANKIVSGYDATTYGANDGVTPIQAASMMMRALGYFQYASDYKDGFETATVRQGTRIGIFTDVGSSATAAMTRNQVAQMALNALECTMVDAEQSIPNISVGSGDTAVNIEGQVNYVVRTGATNDKMATAIKKNTPTGSGTDGTTGQTIELGEQLYNGDLKKDTSTDNFGAPSTVWTYKNTKIGTYANEADASYTTEVKLRDIHKDLGLSGEIAANKVKFVIDGVDDTTASTIYANDGTTDLNGVKLISADSGNGALKLGGNGVLVKAYRVDDDEVTICVINTYVLQVDGEYDTRREELRLKELDGVTELPRGVDTKLSSEDLDNLDTFGDGDYVLVTLAGKEIQTVKAAETFTDTVTAYVAKRGDANSNSVTAGGVTYKYDKNYTAKTYEVKEQYVLVLDSYGYVIFADGVDIEDQYVYVVSARPRGGVKADMEADAYFEDGTNEVILVTGDSVDDLGWDATGGEDDIHAWFTYERKSGGKYELIPLSSKEDVGSEPETPVGSTTIADTNSARVTYATNPAKTFLANADTTFIVLRGDTVTVYNGIREIPTIESESTGVYVNAVMDGSYAKYVFIEGAKDQLHIKGGVDAHIYVYDEEPTVTVDEDGDRVYTYSVIRDGELTTIDMNSRTYASGKDWTLGLYGDLTTDSKGYIETAVRVADDKDAKKLGLKAYKVDGPKVEISGDVLSIGGLALVLDRDYAIWVSDGGDTGTLTRNQFNRDYDEGFKGVLYVALDDDKVTEVYVEEDEAVFDAVDASPAASVWQQPESAEELNDWLTQAYADGVFPQGKSIAGSEELVSLGVKQYVTEENGVPTIHLYGTIDADKVYDKNSSDTAVLKAISIWWHGLNDSTGEPNGTFSTMSEFLTKQYNSEDTVFGAVAYSYGQIHRVHLLKKGNDGSATNASGGTSHDWGTFKVDWSELKFPG